MAVIGTYSASKASKAALERRLLAVFTLPSAATGEAAMQQTARELARAICEWLQTVPVVVQVTAADPGLQTATTPGSPTGFPAATMELRGTLSIGE